MEVAPGVLRIPDKFVNCFILVDKEGLFLIDTGLPSSVKLIQKAVSQAGRAVGDIHQVLMTHADGDHYGGLSGLQKITRLQALANPLEAAAIRQGKSSRPLTPKGLVRILLALAAPFFKASPAAIDGYIKPGQVFPILGGLQALSTPGHTPGHMSFYAAQPGILFAGDSINLKNGQPVPSTGANTWDQVKADESFKLQMDLNPQLICAGHCIWRRSS